MEQTNQTVNGINPKDLTEETYDIYCRLYLIQNINEVIPITCLLNYGHVYKLIYSIDPVLFDDFNSHTRKLLLLNQIYSLFMAVDVELSREFLYEKLTYLADNNPAYHKE